MHIWICMCIYICTCIHTYIYAYASIYIRSLGSSHLAQTILAQGLSSQPPSSMAPAVLSCTLLRWPHAASALGLGGGLSQCRLVPCSGGAFHACCHGSCDQRCGLALPIRQAHVTAAMATWRMLRSSGCGGISHWWRFSGKVCYCQDFSEWPQDVASLVYTALSCLQQVAWIAFCVVWSATATTVVYDLITMSFCIYHATRGWLECHWQFSPLRNCGR